MAFGIKEVDDIYWSYSISLKCNDKKWTIDHLRRMADELEKINESIVEIKSGMRDGHESLFLEVITIKNV
jgi:hypothetical protein